MPISMWTPSIAGNTTPGVSVPDSLMFERGQVVDVLTDMHQYFYRKKVALVGDPDHLVSLVQFLTDMDMEIVSVITGTPAGPKFEGSIRAFAGEKTVIKHGLGADMFQFHQLVKRDRPDLIFGNTYAKYIARDEDIPLGRDVQELRRTEPDRARLAELFGDLEFTKLLAQVDSARAAALAPKSAPAAGSGAGSGSPCGDFGTATHPTHTARGARALGESDDRLPVPPAGTSGPPPTLPTPRASRAPSPVSGSATAPEITAFPLPAEIVLDRAGLAGLCAAIRSAQACGVAVLAEGAPYPRAALIWSNRFASSASNATVRN